MIGRTRMRSKLGPIALAVSLLAALCVITIWFALLGAPLAVVSLGLGIWAVRSARKAGAKSATGMAAIVISALAILALPALAVLCNQVACV